ncbi:OmpA family protein [Trichothermofontia sp.]
MPTAPTPTDSRVTPMPFVPASNGPSLGTTTLTPEALAALLQSGPYAPPTASEGLQLFPVAPAPPPAIARPRPRWHTYLWRTVVLTLAGGSAFLVGSVLAERAIGESLFSLPGFDQPPAIATVLHQAGHLRRMGQRLPHAVAIALAPLTRTTPAPSELTDAQQQQLQADLSQLQIELDNLTLRTALLEAQLDGQHPSLPLEQRLQRLAQSSTGSQPPGGLAASWRALTNPAPFTITLPSDALFTPGERALRSESLSILANISADLRRYPRATVQIAVHTDDLGTSEQNRDLSLQQAQTIADYLGTVLGDQYRWVLLGYGEALPLTANQTDSDRQRNRRVEITIVE